jgi:serine/threonine-protein kinase
MGVVYRARDLALDRDVALKLLAPHLADDVAFRERFLTESRVAASLEHPNVVPIHDAGEIDGQLYIVMRLVVGSDLKVVLRGGPLEPARSVRIVEQIASALDAAHARGLVHRDVKPSNVLLDEHGHVYLADFGLSRYLGDAAVALGPGRSLGTADYVAPEQIRCEEVDGRADVYALGCLLYETLAGEPPFRRGTDAATLFAQLEDPPPTLPGLEDVLGKALAKDPADRYATCGELIADAREALGITEPKRSLWPIAAATVGIALIAAALGGFFLTRGDGGVPPLPGADSLVRIDPASNTVAKRIYVGRGASGVATSPGRVWVTNAADGTISLVNVKTLRTQTIPLTQKPTSVAVGAGRVVVADGASRKVSVLNADTGAIRATAEVGGGSWGFLVVGGRDAVWLADTANRDVDRVDAAGGTSGMQIPVPRIRNDLIAAGAKEFTGLANAGGTLWIAGGSAERVLWRIDARSGRVEATIRLPFVPKAVAAGEGAVWVTSLLGDTVSRIDPQTNRVVATIPVGRGPYSIAAGGGAVWVTAAIDDTVSRIDPTTNRVVAVIPVSGAPGQVAVGSEGVWVTVAKPAPSNPAPPGAIKIGIYADCTGGFGFAYEDSLAGATLPLFQRGGRRAGPALTDGVSGVTIGGRPVQLYFGCVAASAVSETTAVLSEQRHLVERVGVKVVIGPTTGIDAHALQEYARLHPETTFLAGSGASPIVDPAPNYFIFSPNTAQWAAGLGSYAYRTLGWRKAVTVTDLASDFQWSQTAQFTAEFCSLGGTITKRVGIADGTTDLAGVVPEIPSSGMDGIFLSTSSNLPFFQALTAAVPTLRRGNLASRLLLGSAASAALPTNTPSARKRAAGVVSAGPFFGPGLAPDAEFATDFAKHFPDTQVTGFFDVPYYNSMTATLKALDAVHGDLSHGQRRFQAALARVEIDAPNGKTTLDARHRAIAPNYIWQLQGPKLAQHVIKTIPNVPVSFGGYFTAKDPPPTLQTPACKRGTPPPWAVR